MSSRLIGSVLMILGTSIGAGMIALPVSTAGYSLPTIFSALIGCWFISTLGAIALVELSLKLPEGSNLISMSKMVYGKFGGVFAWVLYLALMYSLSCAYLTGAGEILTSIAELWSLSLNQTLASFLSLLVFFSVLIRGITVIDWINRCFMAIKGAIYALLVYAVVPHLSLADLVDTNAGTLAAMPSWPMIAVILTSFGYSVIVPTISQYLHQDRRKIYTAVVIGSLIPLAVYTLWILLIQGVLPSEGPYSLLSIAKSDNVNGALLQAIHSTTEDAWVPRVLEAFIPTSVVTSFLGVTLALSDFLADGLGIEKKGKGAWKVWGVTLVPPMAIIMVASSLFLLALEYAGIICLLLLILWPVSLWVGVRCWRPEQDSNLRPSP